LAREGAAPDTPVLSAPAARRLLMAPALKALAGRRARAARLPAAFDQEMQGLFQQRPPRAPGWCPRSSACWCQPQNSQQDGGADEQYCQRRGGAGEQIGRAAHRHHAAAGAATDAQATAFRTLQQDDRYQRQRDQGMHNEQESGQGCVREFQERSRSLAVHRRGSKIMGELDHQADAAAMASRLSALRLAPPTSAPPTSGSSIRLAALSGLTEPP